MAAVDWKKPWPSFTPTFHHEQYPAIDPSQPSMDCSGKIVFITGAGSGIGRAIAEAFAKAHASGIVLLGRNRATLEETAERVQTIGGGVTKCLVTPGDITKSVEIWAAMQSAFQHFDSVPDILVNNAGGTSGNGKLVDIDLDEFWKTFELNVRGPLVVTQAFLRLNLKHSPGESRVVINLPSGAAHLPYFPGGSGYSCSKIAGAKLLECLHHENENWRVFNMQPGVVDTDLARKAGRRAPDNPNLPAGFAVWLSTQPEAEVFNGRFVWANWDVTELLSRRDEILEKDLLTLTLKGWAEDFTSLEMKRIVSSLRGNANKKPEEE